MGRNHTYWDSEFENDYYDNSDFGEYQKNLVFVAMPFTEAMLEIYYTIKEEVRKLGLNAIRVDESVGSGLILKKIMKGIENAEFLIFDLSEEKPNVYYELGYAHGAGNESEEILLIAKKGTKLHFDIAPLSVIFYDSVEDLKSKIYLNLSKMLKICREKEE